MTRRNQENPMSRKLNKIRKPKGFKRGVLRSGLEASVMKDLKRKKFKGTIGIESHELPYTLVKNYLPDIVLVFPNGHVRYIEVKGWYPPIDRAKMKAVKKCNPDLDIRMVFGADNKLHKTSKLRYSDWCKKHGFPYAIGKIPSEWLT